MMLDDELIDSVRDRLVAAGVDDAATEAREMAREAARRGEPEIAGCVMEMAARRAEGIPLAYVLGRVGFMGIVLLAGEGALVPRRETELLARSALGLLDDVQQREGGRQVRIIDMCCGSGNLACGLAAMRKDLRVWAADLTDGCVTMARRNAKHLELQDRVTVHQGDLFAALDGQGLEGTVDVVVCNPPYISSAKLAKERASLTVYEPREAFDGGPYGLSIHQRVIRESLPFLRDGGWLLFEMGLGQHRQLELLFRRVGGYEAPAWAHDEQQQPRVAMAQKKAGT